MANQPEKKIEIHFSKKFVFKVQTTTPFKRVIFEMIKIFVKIRESIFFPVLTRFEGTF